MNESNLHKNVCAFIRMQYPDVIFTSEASGLRLTMGQAVKLKALRSTSNLPDLWILEPRGGYFGLFIELKAETPYKKDGTLRADAHLQGQERMLDRLNALGYMASFGVGFDATVNIIKMYMSQERTFIS